MGNSYNTPFTTESQICITTYEHNTEVDRQNEEHLLMSVEDKNIIDNTILLKDDVFEIVGEDVVKSLKYNNSILKNDNVFKQKKICELERQQKILKKGKLNHDILLQKISDKVKILENNNKLKSNEITQLMNLSEKLKNTNLNYEKQYLEYVDYKEKYEKCCANNNILKNKIIELEKNNEDLETKNKSLLKNNRHLSKIIEEIDKENEIAYNTIENVKMKNASLQISKNGLRKQYNKLILDVIHNVTSNSNKKTMYEYVNNNFSLEPYVINEIINYIQNQIKNIISSSTLN